MNIKPDITEPVCDVTERLSQAWLYSDLFTTVNFVVVNPEHLLVLMETDMLVGTDDASCSIRTYDNNAYVFYLGVVRTSCLLVSALVDAEQIESIRKTFTDMSGHARIQIIANRRFIENTGDPHQGNCVVIQTSQIEMSNMHVAAMFSPLKDYVPPGPSRG